MELCTHVKLSYKQFSNNAMNYTRQIPSEYNYALTDSIEWCYERCLNNARTILGNSGQTLMNKTIHFLSVCNDAMNDAGQILN